MPGTDLENLEAYCPSQWIRQNNIMLLEGPFQFANHEYLQEVMDSYAQKLCVMKATQLGFTIEEVLRSVHGCLFGRYPTGVGYYMPSDVEVQNMSKTKWADILNYNKNAIARFVQRGGKKTDSAAVKKIGTSYIYFVGTTLSRIIDGVKDSSKLRGFTCDCNCFDEPDMMDDDVFEKANKRMAHSSIQDERYISNPTGVGIGIDYLYGKSDQRQWHRLCPHCLEYTCAEIEFMKDPESIIRPPTEPANPKSKGYVVCKKCGKGPLPIFYFDKVSKKFTRWVPKYADREMHGYQISQLCSIYNDPWQILQKYKDPPRGNFKDVMRYSLGMPYTPSEEQLRPSDVYACCENEPMKTKDEGPCIMGVDVGFQHGGKKHVVIGKKFGKKDHRILFMGVRETWNQIRDLAMDMNVKSAGLDIMPDLDQAKKFQKDCPFKVWLCDYRSPRSVGDWAYDEKAEIIKANRTEVMDATHNAVVEKYVMFFRREQIEKWVLQICNPQKRAVQNAQGVTEYRYKGSDDHMRHALNYYWMAAKRAPRARKKGYQRQVYCINE